VADGFFIKKVDSRPASRGGYNMEIEQVQLKNGIALGVKIDMKVAPLLLIKTGKGFVMCGYLNIEAAEKMGDVAARVSGVKTFEDVLNAKVNMLTSKAKELGIKEGMTGKEALEKML
jgi:uncharacterized protein YunC (DUF1805 family)